VKYRIQINSDIVGRVFEKALLADPKSRSNLFHDIRIAFKEEVERLLVKEGIQIYDESSLSYISRRSGKIIGLKSFINRFDVRIDVDFCAGYGHEDYSLGAINYAYSDYCELPSLLPFAAVDEFSIGNIAILVENDNYDIEIVADECIKLVGYSTDISSRKRKSYLCLYGVRFTHDILSPILDRYYERCTCQTHNLDELRIGIVHYPIIFICRRCGRLFTCSCFDGHYDIHYDIFRFLSGDRDSIVRKHIEEMSVRDGVCHLCTNSVPKLQYGHEMYYTSFLRKYLPYHVLFCKKRYGTPYLEKEKDQEVENELRERFGYPRIGERWISETSVYKIVQMLFPSKEVVFHYRGEELNGLEIDIWIPVLKLAIEYQGEQHFQAVEHWGGEEGLRKRKERDQKKRKLCREFGYDLIEFRYDEDLTVDVVEKKLRKYLES